MCTAITYQPRELYMGRSLDYEASYGEEIVMLPRRFPLRFRHGGGSEQGYAILGTAHVADGYPLYYDAVNEKGLGIAGLNFVGNAHYAAPQDGRQNVAQFEFIPWLLRQCATLAEARQLLQAVNLTGTPFSAHFPAAQLHWLLADTTGALTLEPTAAGLQIYENPVGVLTNNAEQLYASVAETAGEYLCSGCAAAGLQPRHGRARSAGRPVLRLALCARRLHEAPLRLRRERGRLRRAVFPHHGDGLADARLL